MKAFARFILSFFANLAMMSFLLCGIWIALMAIGEMKQALIVLCIAEAESLMFSAIYAAEYAESHELDDCIICAKCEK